LEPLEGRDVPSSTSLAFSPDGSKYDLLAVSSTGVLYRYTPGQTASNFTPLAGNVSSASVTYDPNGHEEIDVVYTDGSLVAYGADVPGGQQTVVPSTFGVASESVAYGPSGRQRLIVLDTGLVFSQDASGSYAQLSITGVRSITAIYSADELTDSDFVYTNGTFEIFVANLESMPELLVGGDYTEDGLYEAASITLPPGGLLVRTTIPLDPGGAEIVQVAFGASANASPNNLGFVN